VVTVIQGSDADNESDEETVQEEADVTASETLGNGGQVVHDELVVKTLQGNAIQIMRDQVLLLAQMKRRLL
jgi:hypothetical protein